MTNLILMEATTDTMTEKVKYQQAFSKSRCHDNTSGFEMKSHRVPILSLLIKLLCPIIGYTTSNLKDTHQTFRPLSKVLNPNCLDCML